MRLTRRGLQVALGLIWLLDALLQFQPAMFTRSFPDQVLRPAADGNPGWVAGPVTWAATQVGGHVALANAAFATVQLVIALAILWRRTTAFGLALSVPWALAVWWLGEGLGGVLTSAPSAVAGAPGAVILYALLAVLLWPAPDGPDLITARSGGIGLRGWRPASDNSKKRGRRSRYGGSVAAAGLLGPVAAGLAWAVLWASLAYDTLLAASRAGLAAGVTGLAGGEPGWLASIDQTMGRQLGAHDAAVSAALAVTFAVIAVAVFIPAVTRPVLVVTIALALAVWLVGQDLGGIFTGQGTDPNTGPLLVLLALAYWPRRAGEEPLPVTEPATAPLPARR